MFLRSLAAFQYLDPDIGSTKTMKLRPYGGLIGIDNSPFGQLVQSVQNSSTSCNTSRRTWFYSSVQS